MILPGCRRKVITIVPAVPLKKGKSGALPLKALNKKRSGLLWSPAARIV
jgi:hypothetical protein